MTFEPCSEPDSASGTKLVELVNLKLWVRQIFVHSSYDTLDIAWIAERPRTAPGEHSQVPSHSKDCVPLHGNSRMTTQVSASSLAAEVVT